ncbi:MAG TPA: DUF106 domain-containing protein [Candidatus Altiarchaeales archaeon]|nr:DUF106 domain-containing protein [Candidatus Altiarchaeales archaeon]
MISVTPDGLIIALISVILSIMSSLVRRATVDIEKVKGAKEKMGEYQKIAREAQKKGHTKKAMKAQEEMTKIMIEQMKHSMRPMLITFIPFILIFMWLRNQYDKIGTVAVLFGFELNWLWWYILISITFSMILNKLMKLS